MTKREKKAARRARAARRRARRLEVGIKRALRERDNINRRYPWVHLVIPVSLALVRKYGVKGGGECPLFGEVGHSGGEK